MMKKMNLSKFLTTLLLGLSLYGTSYMTPVYAMSASEAKAAGYIAEICDGYVKPLKPEGQAIADEINNARRNEYTQIANNRGVPVQVVAKETGQKLCGR